jgi:aspartyl-tRNA(Asn)/glutamyl-tRNA(Gln) amidotransferase subunit A
VRQPASFCGVTAIKPSYGRVSRYGLVAFGSSLDCVGTFGRTVKDSALLLNVIAGTDECDSTTVDAPVPNYFESLEQGAKGLRIGVPAEYFTEGIQPEVEAAIRAALTKMEELGAEIHEINLPHTHYAVAVYYLVATAEASANLARFDSVRYGLRKNQPSLWETYKVTRGEGFGEEVKRRIMLGTYALSAGYYDAYYLKAQKVRTLIKDDFEKAFENVDVIFAPTAPTTAFVIGEKIDDPLQMYLSDIFTLPASLAGVCGITLPCGLDNNQLPIGLQVMGPFLREDLILRAAYAYEQATDWHLQEPPL